jgi:hypothetical protein
VYRSISLFDQASRNIAKSVTGDVLRRGEIADLSEDVRLGALTPQNVEHIFDMIEASPTFELLILFIEQSNQWAVDAVKDIVLTKPTIIVNRKSFESSEYIEKEILRIESNTFNNIEDPPLDKSNRVGYGGDPDTQDLELLTGTWFVTNNNPSLYHAMIDILGKYLELKNKGVDFSGIVLRTLRSIEMSEQITNFFIKYFNTRHHLNNLQDFKPFMTEEELFWAKLTSFPVVLHKGTANTFATFRDGSLNQNRLIEKHAADIRDFLLKEISPSDSVDSKIFLADARLTGSGRSISEKDYQKVISFFEGRGYSIINQSSMPLDEQLALAMSATHVATFMGSSCTLSLACKKDANFIVLNPSVQKYIFPHPRLVKKSCNLIYYPFSVEEIINQISGESLETI